MGKSLLGATSINERSDVDDELCLELESLCVMDVPE